MGTQGALDCGWRLRRDPLAALVLCNLRGLGYPLWALHCVSGLAGAEQTPCLVPKVWPWHPGAGHPPPRHRTPRPFSSFFSSFSFFLSPPFPPPTLSFPSSSLGSPSSLSPSCINIPAQGRKTGHVSFLSLAGLQTVTGPLCALASRSFLPPPLPSPPQEGYLRKGILGEGGGMGARQRPRLPWPPSLGPIRSCSGIRGPKRHPAFVALWGTWGAALNLQGQRRAPVSSPKPAV